MKKLRSVVLKKEFALLWYSEYRYFSHVMVNEIVRGSYCGIEYRRMYLL